MKYNLINDVRTTQQRLATKVYESGKFDAVLDFIVLCFVAVGIWSLIHVIA